MNHVPVAVIGAGPTGVTAAILLAQYGIDTLVLDRWPTVYSQPRAVHMDDEVRRIVDRIGLSDEFAAISRPARGLRLLDADHGVLAEFRRDPATSANGFPQANMFDQPKFEELLRTRLADQPHARLWGGVEVVDIDDPAGGPVRITLTEDGCKHVLTADYVLGCDGANSLVRNRIGTCMHELRFAQRWLVVDIATVTELHQWDGVHQVCDPHRAATFMRIGDTRYRWEFQLLPGESADHFQTLDVLHPLIAPWTAGVPAADLAVLRVAEYTFRAQLADRWRRGNVFLLGDAAHLTPPFIGQGLGAGLRDAMNLSWKLAGVIASSLPESILDTYQTERRPHTHSMIRLALTVGHAMTSGGELGSLARRVVVPRLRLIPGVRSRITSSETPRLRRARTAGRLAGRLCPNPMTRAGSRLDTELGAGFAVVTLAVTEAERKLIESRGARVHVVEPDGGLARWLRDGHATAAIIRPDRTVLRAGRDLTGLCGALPIFGAGADGSDADGHVTVDEDVR